MSVKSTQEPLIYRVQAGKPFWRRKWQAEWDLSYWGPRAYTKRGVLRKAQRWIDRGDEWCIKNARRRQWLRAYVTQRSDHFYSACRRSGELRGAWRR